MAGEETTGACPLCTTGRWGTWEGDEKCHICWGHKRLPLELIAIFWMYKDDPNPGGFSPRAEQAGWEYVNDSWKPKNQESA